MGRVQVRSGDVGKSEGHILLRDPGDLLYYKDFAGTISGVSGFQIVVRREDWSHSKTCEELHAVLEEIGVSDLTLCNSMLWAPENRISMYHSKKFANSSEELGALGVKCSGVLFREKEVAGWRCLFGKTLDQINYALTVRESGSGHAFMLNPISSTDDESICDIVAHLVARTRTVTHRYHEFAVIASSSREFGVISLNVFPSHYDDTIMIEVVIPT